MKTAAKFQEIKRLSRLDKQRCRRGAEIYLNMFVLN